MTEVYGASDDLIEFEGDFRGEVPYYDNEEGIGFLVVLSDGTLLEIKYGKDDRAIWEIKLRERGSLFKYIAQCTDEDADRYSDTAYFCEGIKWAYVAKEWERAS